ncbi:helix-turn-helix domain-containing protein [Collinsella sp. LCP21S3_A3]
MNRYTQKALAPAEAADALSVSIKTLRRWADAEPPLIRSVRLPSGHRRFPRSEIDRLLGAKVPEGSES